MTEFPPRLLEELRALFTSSGVVLYHNPTASEDAPDPHFRSIEFREGTGTRVIDLSLAFDGGKKVKVTLIADDFDVKGPSRRVDPHSRFSDLASTIYTLAVAWIFGREEEEGFPDRVYLRPFRTSEITTISVVLFSALSGKTDLPIRAVVSIDGEPVGVLPKDESHATFVVPRREYRVRVDVGGSSSNECTSKGLFNRLFLCRIDGDASRPRVTLTPRGAPPRARRRFPRQLTLSSEDERDEMARRRPLRVAAVAALQSAAKILAEARIDTQLRSCGWSPRLTDDLATACRRLATILDEREWQLTQGLGDLGLERWLRAYVPSVAGTDPLQEAILQASAALKVLTAMGDNGMAPTPEAQS